MDIMLVQDFKVLSLKKKVLHMQGSCYAYHQDYWSYVILSWRTKQQEREWQALGVWDFSAGLLFIETGFKWAQIEPNI